MTENDGHGRRVKQTSLRGDLEASAMLSAFTIAANLIGYYGIEAARVNIPITWLAALIVFWLVVVNIPLARRHLARRKS